MENTKKARKVTEKEKWYAVIIRQRKKSLSFLRNHPYKDDDQKEYNS